MWISKKKLDEKLRLEREEAYKDLEEQSQWELLETLSKEVAELKDIVKNGY